MAGGRGRDPLEDERQRRTKSLRMWRVARGLSQSEVAEAIGKTRQTVSNYERAGGTLPDDETLERLAGLYGATPDALRRGVYPTEREFRDQYPHFAKNFRNREAEIAGREAMARDEAPATTLPSVVTGLPFEVRVWLQQELLDYAKAGVSEELLRSARDLYERPEVFSFYAEGVPKARTEEEVLMGMRAMSAVVRHTLIRRGFKVAADTPF